MDPEYVVRVHRKYCDWLWRFVPEGAELTALRRDIAWRAWECCVALRLGVVLWNDVPPDVIDAFGIPVRADRGVDFLSPCLRTCGQIKWRVESKRVNDRELAMCLYAMNNLSSCTEWLIVVTVGAQISKLSRHTLSTWRMGCRPQVEEWDPCGFTEDLGEWRAQALVPQVRAGQPGGSRQARPYQLEAVDFFFQNAGEGKPLRFQMACGTGKTFFYGLIFQRDKQAHPGGRYVIFMPWRDLARQTASELEGEPFGFRISVVGDGEHDADPAADVVVCVYPSAKRLAAESFRIKVVDEAHHLESEETEGHRGVIEQQVTSDLTAHFSATFRAADAVDFRYDFDRAVTERYVCDFVVTVALLSSGDRVKAVARLLRERHMDWSPALVFFNRTDRAVECAKELCEQGIKAEYIGGDSTRADRELAKQELASGALHVICACRVFNEGVSISELRTVVFGDVRESHINRQQVAMRVTRWHPAKPFANVVLAVGVDHLSREAEEEGLRGLVRSLSELSPDFRRAVVERRSGGRLRVLSAGSFVAESHESAELLLEQTFDRLGNCLKRAEVGTFELCLAALRIWCERHPGTLPKQKGSTLKERALARWLTYLSHEALTPPQLAQLASIPCMAVKLATWPVPRQATWDQAYARVKAWCDVHEGRLPSRHVQADSVEVKHAAWLANQGRKKLPEERVEALRLLGERQRTYTRVAKNEDWDSSYERLRLWMAAHEGKTPKESISRGREELRAAQWLGHQRRLLRDRKVPGAKADKLRALGIEGF